MAEGESFRNMLGLDKILFCEVGDSAGNFKDFVVAAGGKIESIEGGGDKLVGGGSDLQVI